MIVQLHCKSHIFQTQSIPIRNKISDSLIFQNIPDQILNYQQLELYIYSNMHFFSGGSGFPFGGFSSRDDDDDDDLPNNEKYYNILNLKKECSQTEVKKAYTDLAKKHHPDKQGGNAEKFKQITEAYQVLNDPEKRRIYDKYGEKGLEDNGQSDLMSMFFGGGMGRQTSKRVQKVKPTKKPLQISLETAYKGEVIKVPIKRYRCCTTCQGKGGSDVKTCTQCKGKGSVVKMLQLGPGMYQQMQSNCASCKGEGKIIEQKNRCKNCKGQKVIEQQKNVQVPVEKGVPHGFAITIPGEGDELPDCLSGDLIFIVSIKKNETFSRVGADLFLKKKISLFEALTGFNFIIKHLDGSSIKIQTHNGDVISDKQKKVVRGMGMPFYQNDSNYGNLIIEFEVQMPQAGAIKVEQYQALAKVLPGKINPKPKNADYELLQDFHAQDMHTNEQGGYKKQQQQQQQETHGRRVECNAQ